MTYRRIIENPNLPPEPKRKGSASVYEELKRTQQKLARLKEEVAHLHQASHTKENAILRREATRYRQALSYIAFKLDTGGVDDEELRSIVQTALLLRGLKVAHRRQIERLHEREGNPR